jgi:hypothetical protein
MDAIVLERLHDELCKSERAPVTRAARLVALVGRGFSRFIEQLGAGVSEKTADADTGHATPTELDFHQSTPLPPRSASMHTSPAMQSLLQRSLWHFDGPAQNATAHFMHSAPVLLSLAHSVRRVADAFHEVLFLLANAVRFDAYALSSWHANCAGSAVRDEGVAEGAVAWLLHVTQPG